MKNLFTKNLALPLPVSPGVVIKLLSVLFLGLVTATTQAKNYYISASGNNSNNGLSPASAWQSIAKVNSSFSSFAPGDSILFKSGETFSGSIKISKSGTSSSPIVISSYGTGSKPIISGFVTLTGWINVSGNIWECSAGTLKNDVNILTVNETPYAVGRTPNSGFYTYQSASASQMTSSQLNGSYVGAEAVIRKIAYVAERVKITAQSGNTITYAKTNTIDPATSNSPQNGNANYGFFLQRFSSSLDQFGEWYFNTSTKKMQIYSAGNPSGYSIKASYVDTLIAMNNMTNIVASNLSLEGAGRSAVFSKDGSNIKIKNCDFNNNTRPVNVHNTLNIVVDNCTMNNSFNNAIFILNNHTKQITITNTTINNTGQLMGMGAFWSEANLKGIFVEADISTSANFINIIGNVVKNTGSSGIQFQGSNVIIRRNLIENFCNKLDDGGGIYTWLGSSSTVHSNRIIDSNMVLNSIGAPDGAGGHADVVGYFQDREGKNIIGKNNTIANIAGNGFQSTNPSNHVFNNNTIYNCAVAINVNKYPYSEISKLSIKGNIIYQKDSSQLNFLHTNNNLNLPTVMTAAQSLSNQWDMDSNWVSNMKYAGYQYFTSTNGSTYTFPPKLALTQWQNTYANDQHSVLPKVAVTATNTRFEYNATNTAKTISITGQSYIDPKGNVYNNTVTIPAWTSIILIKNGAASSNQSPVANAGTAKVITLPTNGTSLTGSGTDADGSISSYAWVKISGPSSGTIATANAAATAVNNLGQGVYQYELTVTDNGGSTGKSTVQVTVNSTSNQAPTANAGTNKTITLPANSSSLAGTGADTDGTIATYLWTKTGGPAGGTIGSANSATTGVTALIGGTYSYQLTVTDNDGATATATTQITVSSSGNILPVANAGTDITIAFPTTGKTLTGTGKDPDGTIRSYSWMQLSGPSASTVVSPSASQTVVNKLVKGVYSFQLTVTDNSGGSATDLIQVFVSSTSTSNQAPVANAGTDITIALPTTGKTLTGTGKDPDGIISSYSWTQISGPSASTVVSPSASQTVVNKLVKGVYSYQLKVTDNSGNSATDMIQVTVNAAVNHRPLANAGINKSITLPVNNVSLTESGTDADATISSYAWVKVSGPSSGTIAKGNAANTAVNNLERGVYQYELTVTDSNGAIGKDTVQVSVNAARTAVPVPGLSTSGVNEFNVYPNPVANIANVNISSAKGNSKLYISVVDQIGKLVKYTELVNQDRISNLKLDMSSLKNGFYIIMVRFEDGQRLSSKVIKYGGK